MLNGCNFSGCIHARNRRIRRTPCHALVRGIFGSYYSFENCRFPFGKFNISEFHFNVYRADFVYSKNIKEVPPTVGFSVIFSAVIRNAQRNILIHNLLKTIADQSWRNRIERSDGGQSKATREGLIADFSDRAGDDNGGQPGAAVENGITDFGDRIWNGDGCQPGAVIESTPTDFSDRIWNG